MSGLIEDSWAEHLLLQSVVLMLFCSQHVKEAEPPSTDTLLEKGGIL